MLRKLSIVLCAFLALSSCLNKPQTSESETEANEVKTGEIPFADAFAVISESCLPCHSQTALPEVIVRVKQAPFETMDGEKKERLVAELEGLLEALEEGDPLDYTSEANLNRTFKGLPGEFYLMLEKGVMPPPWAAEMMALIEWGGYRTLTPEKRGLLLNYSRPFSEKYLP